MTNALTPIERASVALGASAHEKELSTLAGKFTGIKSITNSDGYKDAQSARMELVKARTDMEKKGKAARDDANAFSKAVIAEEKRLLSIIGPEEARIKGLQDAWDAVIEAEKQAAAKVETDRIAAEQKAIKDAEDTRIAAEKAELARQQDELRMAQEAHAELERLARLKIEDQERESRMRIEEQERQARQVREVEEAKAKKLRDAEEDRLKAERARLDAERRAADEVAHAERKRQQDAEFAAAALLRKEREAEESRQREIRRKEAERMDAKEILSEFAARFGHLKEFEGVVDAINKTFIASEAYPTYLVPTVLPGFG